MKTVDIATSLFIKNRERLSNALKPNSLAVLHSNDEMHRSADQYFPYRQDSDLFYLTGINQEKTILLISPDNTDETMREILFIRKPDKKLETWEGHKLSREEAKLISGIKTIRYTNEYESFLANQMANAKQVYLNLPEFQKIIPELPNRNLRFAHDLQLKFPAHSYERLAPVMSNLRIIKSDTEISLIREACKITGDTFKKILKTIKPGMYEYQIEAELTYEFMKRGAKGHSFHPIVASGINACSLHYSYNNNLCNDGDLLLIDFGAEYGNYAADCSRTIPVNGKFTSRQKEVYKSVSEVFSFARSLMIPGNTINNIHSEVCKRFEQEHIKLGLYSSEEVNSNKDERLYERYYMHGTSHFMGLDVHDAGSKDAELKPGMILTCEPGIYVTQEKTGIRLENDILITNSGNIDLMKDIPIDPEEIEKIMAEG